MNRLTLRRQMSMLLRAGLVTRYHTRTTHVQDTVGRHSFMVTWLCYILSNGKPSRNLLLAALQHDVPEAVTGDVPSPVTRLLGKHAIKRLEDQVLHRMELKKIKLRPLEQLILKAADALDGLMFTTQEVRGFGNARLTMVKNRYEQYLRTHAAAIEELDRGTAALVRDLMDLCGAMFDVQTTEDEENVCL